MANPSPTTAEQVGALLDDGKTVLEISRILEISPAAIYQHIKHHGFEKPSDRRAS